MNCQCLRPRIPRGIPEQCFSDSLPVPGRLHKKQGNMRSSAPQSQNTCKRPLLKGAVDEKAPALAAVRDKAAEGLDPSGGYAGASNSLKYPPDKFHGRR